MTRNMTALIGFVLLAGCSGGGGDSSTTSTAAPPPSPTAQPDMLTVIPQGILRGKANGQGQREILRAPNLLRSNVFVDEGNIVYQRNGQTLDIWTVRADGTGDHALLNTANDEFLQAVSWPWVIYSDDTSYKSLNAVTQGQFRLFNFSDARLQFTDARIIISEYSRISSQSFTGTDPLVYVDSIPDRYELPPPAIVADRLVYRRLTDDGLLTPVTFTTNLFSIPVLGGTTITLDGGQFYVSFAGALGSRVVYHRCQFGGGLAAGPCDVVSVNNDGTAPVVLASHPANEAVQGIVGDQVIIRRNLSGNDHLIAVPVTGGAERLLMTMTDNEFVQLTTTNLIVVTRPSGTWSLDLNGTLTKLGTVVGDSGFVAVGDSVCMNRVTAVWCMPLDGAGPQVKIADDGRVVGVL